MRGRCESIRRYKFHGRKWYASAYGPLVAQCVEEHLSGRFDLISWVPLSEKRRRERGYDQAFLLARAVGHELGMHRSPPCARRATIRPSRD